MKPRIQTVGRSARGLMAAFTPTLIAVQPAAQAGGAGQKLTRLRVTAQAEHGLTHPAQRAGFQLVGHRFDIYGICPRCQSAEFGS